MPASTLDALFRPRSIAVVGASEDPTRIGGRILFNLLTANFPGTIHPINPKRDTVQGLTAYPGIAALPEPVDCVVVAVPGEAVLPVMHDCVARGVKAAVIFSAGFAEAGPEGVRRQAELRALVDRSGMRVLGPNCLGLYRIATATWLTFTTLFQEKVEGPTLGMVSQSGGSASQILKLAQNRGLAVGTYITTGNEVDIEFGEGLEFLAEDPATSVILAYIEGIRNPESFLRGLEAARRNRKPVVLLKVGRTSQGAQAAASHTASLAGEDVVYDAIFRAHGVIRARSTEELIDIAYAASRAPLPKAPQAGSPPAGGRRLGVVTISGGMGAQIADAAFDAGLLLEPLDAATQEKLKQLCPPGSPVNPVDITAQLSTDPHLLAGSMRLILDSGRCDMVFAFFGIYAGVPALGGVFAEDLAVLRRDHPDALLGLGVVCSREEALPYEAAGFLVFEEPARAVRAMAALADVAAAFAAVPDNESRSPRLSGDRIEITPGTRFSEVEAKKLLERIGIRSPVEITVPDLAALQAVATQVPLPSALKIVSRDIVHKSDVGGVALGLVDADAVLRAASVMQEQVARAAPDALLEGFLVSEMVRPAPELILGARIDPLFGPLVMAGLGGVTAELFGDVALRPAPVSHDTALEMLRSLRSFPLLSGFRGAPLADVDAAAAAIVALSRLAADNVHSLDTIEINPLRVLAPGEGAVALDAVIETRPAS